MTAKSCALALFVMLVGAAPARAAYQPTTVAAGPDAVGAAPTQPPLFVAGIDPSGNIKPFTFTSGGLALFSDPAAELALSQLVTALGAPMQAGGSVGNTGFNALQNGQANSATNQFFEQTVGPSMQAPGTASTIARAVQRADGKAVFASGDVIGNTAFGANQGTAAGVAGAWPTVAYAPNAAAAARVITKTSLSVSTNTQVCPAAVGPLQSEEIQVSAAAVGLGLNGQTLNSAAFGNAAGSPDLVMPTAGSQYSVPAPSTNAITAYSANPAFVICIQTARQ